MDNGLNVWLFDLVSLELLDKDKFNFFVKERDLFVSRIVFRGSVLFCVDFDVSNIGVDVLDIVGRLDFFGVRSGDMINVWIGFGFCDVVIGVVGVELDLELLIWNKDICICIFYW